MKLQLFSDLHLEFADFQPDTSQADVVVLAGDIHVKDKGVRWALAAIPDKPVIYVLGNHEYYGATYPTLLDKLKTLAAGSNVHVLENEMLSLDGVNFFGCTLWTNFELFGDPRVAGFHCQQRMNDFVKIRKAPNYSKLRSLDVAIIHCHSMHWLKQALAQHQGQTNVVITHHAPSMQSVPARYQQDMLSAAYASHLEPFILDTQPALWLHGHMHERADYQLGHCRVVCNPRGYPQEANDEFDAAMLLEISHHE